MVNKPPAEPHRKVVIGVWIELLGLTKAQLIAFQEWQLQTHVLPFRGSSRCGCVEDVGWHAGAYSPLDSAAVLTYLREHGIQLAQDDKAELR